jgi:hypothetical protein
MVESMKGLTDEIRLTIGESKRQGGTIRNLQETSSDLRESYQTLRE